MSNAKKADKQLADLPAENKETVSVDAGQADAVRGGSKPAGEGSNLKYKQPGP